MYGSEFGTKVGLFDLRCVQISSRDTRKAKNAGWYNKYGAKLGWEDSIQDFFTIRGRAAYTLRSCTHIIASDNIYLVCDFTKEVPNNWDVKVINRKRAAQLVRSKT